MHILAINLMPAAVAGAALGLLYFGGLWLTVRRISCSARPALLMFGSFVVRLLAALCGFYLVMNGSWERLLACLAGFLAVRLVLTRIVRSGEAAVRLSGERGRSL